MAIFWNLMNRTPVGIELRPVTKRSDLEKVFSVWSAAAGGRRSIQFLLRQAKYNSSVGAFKKNGTLIAWVFRYVLYKSPEN